MEILEKKREATKLVSVVIPSYKRSDTLSRAIESVLNQTYENVEILVVDDNEPGDDFSLIVNDVVESFNSNKVILVTQPKHINGAAARNAGIKAAKGEFIALLDDDDEWHPMKIELQIKALEQNPSYNGCSCLYRMYQNGREIKACHPYTSEDLHYKILSRQVSVYTSTVILKKTCLFSNGLFDETLLRGQDLQLLLDFTYNDNLFVLNEYLVKLHSDSDINRPNIERVIFNKYALFEKCNRHFEKYTKSQRELAYSAHYFEIAYNALKQGKYTIAIKFILKNGFNLKSYINVFQRLKKR